MKFIIISIFFTIIGWNIFSGFYQAVGFGLTLGILVFIILESNDTFMFREWTLFLYSVNYLLSPAITYDFDSTKIVYGMKIAPEYYFSLAFPGLILFALGMFCIPSKIFRPNFNSIRNVTLLNESFLIKLTLFGFFCSLSGEYFSSNFAFFIYLLSTVRFVGVFALFASNQKKYWYLILLVLGFEIYNGFKNAMFHDAVMWVVFFLLFFLYVRKPKLIFKLIGAVVFVFIILLIQAFKVDYRERVWRGSEIANIETISDVGFANANANLAGEDNLLGTLNRGNQAWIFASTVENMDRTNEFQGMNNIYLYMEAALLPRFLAPNKITAGNTQIFNKFSGHTINSRTAMGLGVFSDGYIAYGKAGVYILPFLLGLLFSLTFRLVQGWSKISPFYVLFILPLLSYAVRPDCELQTTINHLVKGAIVFGIIVNLTKYRFSLNSINLFRK